MWCDMMKAYSGEQQHSVGVAVFVRYILVIHKAAFCSNRVEN